MRDLVADTTVEAANYGRNKILSELGQQVLPFPDRIQLALRERTFEASRSTMSRLTGDVMGVLSDASREGLGIRDAALRLEDQFRDMREFELRRIARTETNRAQQDAAMTTEKELGVRFHQWHTAGGERVRSSHREQHNEIVAVGAEFSNGLVRPGDSSGPLSEFINCRCRLIPFIIPHGMRAPVDMAQFHAGDLVQVAA